jgi:hypothetical protein
MAAICVHDALSGLVRGTVPIGVDTPWPGTKVKGDEADDRSQNRKNIYRMDFLVKISVMTTL